MQRGREWREEDWDQDRSRRWQGGEGWERDPYRESPQREWQGSSRAGEGYRGERWRGGEGYRGEGYRGGEGQRGEGDGSRGFRGGSAYPGQRGAMYGGAYGGQGGYGRFGGQLGSQGYGGGWQREEPQYGPYDVHQSGGYGGGGGYGSGGRGGGSYGGGTYGAHGGGHQGFGSSMGMEEDYGRGEYEYGGRGRDYSYERQGGGSPWSQREEPRGRGGMGDWGRGTPEWSGGGYGGGSYYSGHSGRGGASTMGRRSEKRGPKNYQRSDERIREDVCDRLMSTDLDCSDVEIKVDQGEVTLTGSAESGETRREVERVAESVAGVKEVTNQIRTQRETEDDDRRSRQTGSQGSSSSTGTGSGTSGRQTSPSQGRT